MGSNHQVSDIIDKIRIRHAQVDEITKTAVGAIYRFNDQLTMHSYFIAEFLGDGEIEQLASINGEKIGHDFQMDSDTVIYVIGVSFGYTF